MSVQKNTIEYIVETAEANLQIIEAVSKLITKKDPEEFVFSCGKWGVQWIKIIYKKGKIKVKTRENEKK